MSRRGSERRRRSGWLAARYNEQEEARVRQKATDAGQSVSALIRSATLSYRPPRSKIDQDAVTAILTHMASLKGAVGKCGSVFNQLVVTLYRGREVEEHAFLAEWEELKGRLDDDWNEIRLACMQALGHELDRRPPGSPEDPS